MVRPVTWSKGRDDMNNSLSGSRGKLVAGAIVIAVLALGVLISAQREAGNVTTPLAVVLPQDDAMQTDSDLATNDDTPEPEVAPDVTPPAFDEVRRESDGITVVAGRAAPGATVELLRDGEVIGTATADDTGKFATLALIAPDGKGHVLSLSQNVDGADIASLDEIILAPTQAPAAPAQVARGATPEVQTAPTTPTDETIAPTAPTDEAVAAMNAPADPEAETAPASAGKPEEVAVLKSTEAGVELLNAAAPEILKSVELDTISYSDSGAVQLAGRAQPDTETVRVYIDNNAVVSLPVDEDGRWRGDVPNVDEGIYTLRVDEVGADGTVTSRVETPFKRESADVLANATAAQDGPIRAITVQTGATLWAIARDRYGDGRLYVRVFSANQKDIRDPDLIYPGQIFDLPD